MVKYRFFVLNAPETVDPINSKEHKEFADSVMKKLEAGENIVLPYGWDLRGYYETDE